MKFTFPIIAKKDTELSIANSLKLPYLGRNLQIMLTQDEKDEIVRIGYKAFLQKVISTMLTIDDKKCPIKPENRIDTVLDTVLSKKKMNLDANGEFDMELSVDIDFMSPRKRVRFFERFLAPLAKVVVVLQISAEVVLTIGSLQLTQQSVLPSDDSSSTAVSIIQSVIAGLSHLLIAFTGPGLIFMDNFAYELDTGLTKAKEMFQNALINVGQPAIEDNSIQNTVPLIIFSPVTKAKIALCKLALLIVAIDSIWSYGTYDYQETMSLRDSIDQIETFSPNFIMASAYASFVLDQLADPILLISLIMIGFKMIDRYFYSGLNELDEVEIINLHDEYFALPSRDYNSISSRSISRSNSEIEASRINSSIASDTSMIIEVDDTHGTSNSNTQRSPSLSRG